MTEGDGWPTTSDADGSVGRVRSRVSWSRAARAKAGARLAFGRSARPERTDRSWDEHRAERTQSTRRRPAAGGSGCGGRGLWRARQDEGAPRVRRRRCSRFPRDVAGGGVHGRALRTAGDGDGLGRRSDPQWSCPSAVSTSGDRWQLDGPLAASARCLSITGTCVSSPCSAHARAGRSSRANRGGELCDPDGCDCGRGEQSGSHPHSGQAVPVRSRTSRHRGLANSVTRRPATCQAVRCRFPLPPIIDRELRAQAIHPFHRVLSILLADA